MGLQKQPPEYSLTIVHADGGRSRILMRKDRRRVEGSEGGHSTFVIARGDLGVIWSRQPGGLWIEMPVDQRLFSSQLELTLVTEWKEIGPAEVEGEPCTLYHGFDADGSLLEACYVLPSGIRRREIRYRRDGTVGGVSECVDIVVGPPPLEHFELPPDAKFAGKRRRKR